jgi:hypothetical protein
MLLETALTVKRYIHSAVRDGAPDFELRVLWW